MPLQDSVCHEKMGTSHLVVKIYDPRRHLIPSVGVPNDLTHETLPIDFDDLQYPECRFYMAGGFPSHGSTPTYPNQSYQSSIFSWDFP